MTFELYCYLAVGAICAASWFCVCSIPLFGILQQSGYFGKPFFKWYCRKGNMLPRRYALLALTLVLLTAIFDLCFSFWDAPYANAMSALPFTGLCLLFVVASRRALKVPFKRTGRAVRIAVCYWVLLFACLFGGGIGLSFAANAIGGELVLLFRYVPLTLLPLVFFLLLAAANAVMKIYDVPRNEAYIRKAAKALQESRCVKVGITGSFAKTTVKNMAAAILSQRFSVVATPASYNTPIGIARTVNDSHGAIDCDIFLAEMGARRVGDIAELCDLVRPEYGVITGICPQHLETFGSLENIEKEKGVLAERTKYTVLGASAAGIGAENALVAGRDFAADRIVCTTEGTDFRLRVGEEKISVHTALLGKHAAEDIALAAALCRTLGMSMSEIAAGIERIAPVPHRLEKIEANGLNILDDSYNSNTEGAKDAVYVLRLFGGKKYVVTPGLVEMGTLETEANEALGAQLAGLDGVILVGETLVLSVRAGYLAAGGDEEKLRVVPSLKAAQAVLSQELTAGDSVLFLNDLPDIYN